MGRVVRIIVIPGTQIRDDVFKIRVQEPVARERPGCKDTLWRCTGSLRKEGSPLLGDFALAATAEPGAHDDMLTCYLKIHGRWAAGVVRERKSDAIAEKRRHFEIKIFDSPGYAHECQKYARE
jgi:hypothetical protein